MDPLGSNTHRALGINEIFTHVVNQLVQDSTLPKQDLVNIALTCRAFQEPAIDRLWHTIPGLEPLLDCLSEETKASSRKYEAQVNDKESLDAIRSLNEKEWDRFNWYAKRVRCLFLDFDCKRPDSIGVGVKSETLLRILKPFFGTSPALPALSHLHITSASAFKQACLILVIPPTLCYVHVLYSRFDSRDGASEFLTFLRRHAPGLKGLYFPRRGQTPDQIKTALSFPGLQELMIYPTIDRMLLTPPAQPSLPLQSLQIYSDHLVFDRDSIETPTQLLGHIRPNSLKRLSITWALAYCDNTLLPLTTAISAFGDTLEHCEVALSGLGVRSTAIDYTTLAPLSRIHHMHVLSLQTTPCINQAEFLSLLPSWPHLEVLHLGVWKGDKGDTNFSFDILKHIASLCPNIQFLALPLVAGVGVSDEGAADPAPDNSTADNVSPYPPRRNALKQIHFLDTPIGPYLDGPATFLAQVYPYADVNHWPLLRRVLLKREELLGIAFPAQMSRDSDEHQWTDPSQED